MYCLPMCRLTIRLWKRISRPIVMIYLGVYFVRRSKISNYDSVVFKQIEFTYDGQPLGHRAPISNVCFFKERASLNVFLVVEHHFFVGSEHCLSFEIMARENHPSSLPLFGSSYAATLQDCPQQRAPSYAVVPPFIAQMHLCSTEAK
jgi:hypothetical protein